MKRPFISLLVATAFLFLFPVPQVSGATYTELWEAPLVGSQHPYALKSFPIIDSSGNIYASTENTVYSFDSVGNKRWEYSGSNFYPQLVLTAGKVFVATNNYGRLTALNTATGARIWEVSVNPGWTTSLFGAPAVLGDRVYLAYEAQCPLATNEIKAYDVATGVMLAHNDRNTTGGAFGPNWGIISNDLAMPHQSTSSAQIFIPTFEGNLLSITRKELSASVDRGGLARESPAPVLTSDDKNLILLGSGNELQYFKINVNGEEAANPLFTVDLGAAPRLRAVEMGDLILVNVGSPTELVAVSKTLKKIIWRRPLNTTFATLPVLVSGNLVAEVTSKLTFLDLSTGEIKQEIDLGTSDNNYFTGAAVGNGQVYFIDRDNKLVAYGLPAPPKHHPVIFVHGLGGSPADWEAGGNKEDYKIKLWENYSKDSPNYSQNWLLSYSYTGTDAKTGGYNNQGTVEEVTLGMEQAVATLSASFKAAGGDGKVDLVGFSLGGLVIREYLATHPSNHDINHAITIASPHQGAFFADIRKAADVFGFIPTAKEYVISLMEGLGQAARINVDPGNPVVEELYPDSTYINGLKSKAILSPPIFDVIAGSINVKFKQKLFNREFTYTPLDVGDLIMSEQSATTITPLTPSHVVPFSQDLTVPLRFSRDIGFVGLEVSIPELSAVKYRHLAISQQDDVIKETVDLLNNL